jgi:hypothetical protein
MKIEEPFVVKGHAPGPFPDLIPCHPCPTTSGLLRCVALHSSDLSYYAHHGGAVVGDGDGDGDGLWLRVTWQRGLCVFKFSCHMTCLHVTLWELNLEIQYTEFLKSATSPPRQLDKRDGTWGTTKDGVTTSRNARNLPQQPHQRQPVQPRPTVRKPKDDARNGRIRYARYFSF